MESVRRLAINHSVLAEASLTQQASAYLGKGANIQGLGTRVIWAQVYVDVDAEIQSEAYTLMRLHARAKKELEDKELRIAQAVAFHNLLQKDPTLAIAQWPCVK